MKKGFTLLEVLVASMLLGMLMTILTMVFNQSSIAWRTGVAGVVDLNDARNIVGEVRNEADNLYVWRNNSPQLTSVLSIWSPKRNTGAARLRERAVDVAGVVSDVNYNEKINRLNGCVATDDSATKTGSAVRNWLIPCGNGVSAADRSTYTVNVRSAGPNRIHDDFDDVWSFPDDFDL